ncbi:MAG: ribonuclease H-like domain-containing protein [Coprococcus sp.]
MQIFTYNRDYNSINFNLISDNPDELLYFDIETTGLSAKSSDLYMIGYAHKTQDKFVITLLFNDDGCSEPIMLEHFINVIQHHNILISYNGDTFDIPYIKEKLKQFEINYDISSINSFDIFKVIRKYKKKFHLTSMKQSDIEHLIHFKRDTFISGGDLISVYKRYLSASDSSDLKELIRHNLDDIDGLISITDVLAVPKLYNGEFDVLKIDTENGTLNIRLAARHRLPFRINYGYDNIYINGIDDVIYVKLPIIHDTMKFFFSDYKNYYYLPVEDIAIHKSMAAYVDTDHKLKSTKETAFAKKEGDFVFCPKDIGLNFFSYSANDKKKYISVDDLLSADINQLYKYAYTLLCI